MADDVLKSFVVSLGWKVDREGERRVTEAIGSVTRQAGLLAAALGAAALAASAAVAKIAAQFDTLYFTSQRTGATVQNIKGLAYAFGQVGGSGAGAVSAIESFSRSMRTNPGIRQFVRDLGVATEAGGKTRDSVDVLTDAIDAIQKKQPYYVGAQMAALLGIDEQTYNTLSSYRREIKEFRAEYERTARTVGLNNEAAAAASNKFMTALRGLQASAQAVAEKILTDLSPVLTKFLEDIRAWIEKNPETIEKAIRFVIDAAIALVTAFTDLARALTPVAQGFQTIAESLTGKEGLEAAMTAFAAFLVGTWLVKILGAFGQVRIGWLGLLAALGLANAANQNGILAPSKHGSGLEAFVDNLDPGLRRLIYGPTEQQKADQGKPTLLRRMWEGGKKMLGLGGASQTSSTSAEAGGVSAANSDASRALGNAIASVEAGRDGYNTVLGNGAYGKPSKPLTEMTLAEAREFGRSVRARHGSSSAIGRYQIVNTTRDAAQKALGLSDDTLYNEETQERMMRWIARKQGLGAWEGLKINAGAMAKARAAMAAGGALDTPPAAPQAEKPSSSPIPKMDIKPGITAQNFNDRFGAAPPMGATSNSSSVDNRSVKIEHKTDVNINGANDPATTAERLKQTLDRGSELSLRNAQTAIR